MAHAQNQPVPESKVKAAFLVNFPKYVEWPRPVVPNARSPIVIAVLGDDAVAADFANMVAGKFVNGHPLQLRRLRSEAEVNTNCQVLFIGASARERIPSVLAKLGHAPVLTVGESNGFLARGGVINLALKDQRVRFRVNLDAARRARLRISSKLLSVADRVEGKAG